MALNYYRVSGLARGLRAEWSIFVADEEGIPRYLVFDARSSETSMDPVDVKTSRSRVEHVRGGERIVTRIGDDAETFTCTITVPGDDAAPIRTTGR